MRTQERFWEMYLGVTLQKLGYAVSKPSHIGPDFCVDLSGGKLWIEAVTSSGGEGADALKEPDYNESYAIPENQILLRLLSSLSEKYKRFCQYLDSEIVDENDFCVVAINGAKVPYILPDDRDIPYIVQAVLPFGPLGMKIDRDTGKPLWSGRFFRGMVNKKSGSVVPTTVFQDGSYTRLSGIIYSKINPLNMWKPMGEDLLFLHNPTAAKPLPLDWLQAGREFWVEENILQNRLKTILAM